MKENILNTIDDLFTNFFFYDRKYDEELPVGAIDQAIKEGKITALEIKEKIDFILDGNLPQIEKPRFKIKSVEIKRATFKSASKSKLDKEDEVYFIAMGYSDRFGNDESEFSFLATSTLLRFDLKKGELETKNSIYEIID